MTVRFGHSPAGWFRVCVHEGWMTMAAALLQTENLKTVSDDEKLRTYDRAVDLRDLYGAVRVFSALEAIVFSHARWDRIKEIGGMTRIETSLHPHGINVLADPRLGQFALSGGTPDLTGYIADGETLTKDTKKSDERWVQGVPMERRCAIKEAVMAHLTVWADNQTEMNVRRIMVEKAHIDQKRRDDMIDRLALKHL